VIDHGKADELCDIATRCEFPFAYLLGVSFFKHKQRNRRTEVTAARIPRNLHDCVNPAQVFRSCCSGLDTKTRIIERILCRLSLLSKNCQMTSRVDASRSFSHQILQRRAPFCFDLANLALLLVVTFSFSFALIPEHFGVMHRAKSAFPIALLLFAVVIALTNGVKQLQVLFRQFSADNLLSFLSLPSFAFPCLLCPGSRSWKILTLLLAVCVGSVIANNQPDSPGKNGAVHSYLNISVGRSEC